MIYPDLPKTTMIYHLYVVYDLPNLYKKPDEVESEPSVVRPLHSPIEKSPSHNFGTIRLVIMSRCAFWGSRSSKIYFWFLQFRKTGFLDTPFCIFQFFLLFSSGYCVSSLEKTNSKRIE